MESTTSHTKHSVIFPPLLLNKPASYGNEYCEYLSAIGNHAKMVSDGIRQLLAEPNAGLTGKVHVRFRSQKELHGKSWNVIKRGTSFDVKLFFSSSGQLCYTFSGRRGYPLSDHAIVDISDVSLQSQSDSLLERVDMVERLIASIHPNAWPDLRDCLKNPEDLVRLSRLGLGRLSMKSRFPACVISDLESAFANKTDFHYYLPGKNRDIRVKTKLFPDGMLRAWYQSEYPGCGNGQYYLLLNPYTASFMEPD